jgi:hypothetical protein
MWLLILATVFAMGCATPLKATELGGRPIALNGWVPMDDTGTNWQFRLQNKDSLQIIGHCYEVAPSVWIGKYNHGVTDFGKRYEDTFDSLHDCVDWVEHHAFGGCFI